MNVLEKNAVKHRFNDNQIQSVDGLSLILKRYEKFLTFQHVLRVPGKVIDVP